MMQKLYCDHCGQDITPKIPYTNRAHISDMKVEGIIRYKYLWCNHGRWSQHIEYHSLCHECHKQFERLLRDFMQGKHDN